MWANFIVKGVLSAVTRSSQVRSKGPFALKLSKGGLAFFVALFCLGGVPRFAHAQGWAVIAVDDPLTLTQLGVPNRLEMLSLAPHPNFARIWIDQTSLHTFDSRVLVLNTSSLPWVSAMAANPHLKYVLLRLMHGGDDETHSGLKRAWTKLNQLGQVLFSADLPPGYIRMSLTPEKFEELSQLVEADLAAWVQWIGSAAEPQSLNLPLTPTLIHSHEQDPRLVKRLRLYSSFYLDFKSDRAQGSQGDSSLDAALDLYLKIIPNN